MNQPDISVVPLSEASWPLFAKLVEAEGGVWGGCWCIGFHLDPNGPKDQCRPHREAKHSLVCQGKAQAALVLEADEAVGWCQFGLVSDLPNIKNRRNYEAGLGALPDWRITCFYVAKAHRKRGVANLALSGALGQIARAGGGVVEAYPFDVSQGKTSSSFLHAGTLEMFLREGFTQDRQIGKTQWVVKATVAPS